MLIIVILDLLSHVSIGHGSTWSEWWTYDGISGPDFWGIVNPEWNMCSKGKHQSPVNIDPRLILYDPTLKHLHVDKHRMSGTLVNTGHDVKILLDESGPHVVNISAGPLTYHYKVCEIIFHFGSISTMGSEHTINGQSFPAEIQIIGYNTDLYGNLTQATYSPHGLVYIGLLVQIGKKANMEFEMLSHDLKQVRYKGQQVRIRHLSIHGLLPQTNDFMTYEGSMTQPGCHETVTWIIMNRPIYVTLEHMKILRDIMQGDKNNPKIGMENNSRPTTPLNNRPIRTNINYPAPSKGCTMEKEMYYQASVWDRS